MKSVTEINNERKRQFKTYNNTVDMFTPGTRVRVICVCQDFQFFNCYTQNTYGVVDRIGTSGMIIVKWDEPRHYDNGTIQYEFNFNPDDLYIVSNNPISLFVFATSYYCNCRVHDGGSYSDLIFKTEWQGVLDYILETRQDTEVHDIYSVKSDLDWEMYAEVYYEFSNHSVSGIKIKVKGDFKYRTVDNGSGTLIWEIQDE